MTPAPDSHRPPSLDALAAERWWRDLHALADAPWLHREVASRMLERLDWLKLQAGPKLLWQPDLAGLEAAKAFQTRFGGLDAACVRAESAFFDENHHTVQSFIASDATKTVVNPKQAQSGFLRQTWRSLANRLGGTGPAAAKSLSITQASAQGNAQLVWSNLLLHAHPDPSELMAQWHTSLAVGGCAMFSALGVDTGKELSRLHAELGFGPAAAQLTDMHDWGDMMAGAGFADPVMDMEHLTLTYPDADALLSDWRSFGRNAHVARVAGLRGRRWLAGYKCAISECLRRSDGQLAVTVEVIYGHAFKPEARLKMSAESAISMREMRQMLARRR